MVIMIMDGVLAIRIVIITVYNVIKKLFLWLVSAGIGSNAYAPIGLKEIGNYMYIINVSFN